MDKQKFQSLVSMAKALQRLDSDRSEFWVGFQRGLRRLYHGENFDTDQMHEKWMNCAQGEYRKWQQVGYRVGYHYDDLLVGGPEDIQPLRKLLTLSVDDLAEIAAVSPRTVEGWEQGRPIFGPVLQLLRKFLMI